LANVLFTTELVRRYGKSGIKSYSLHPGAVRTEIWRDVVKKPAYKFLIYASYPLLWLIMKNNEEGA